MDLMLGRIFTFFSYFFILSILASWYIELRVFFLAAYIYLTGVAGGGVVIWVGTVDINSHSGRVKIGIGVGILISWTRAAWWE